MQTTMTKYLGWLVVFLVIVGLGYYFAHSSLAEPQQTQAPAQNVRVSPPPPKLTQEEMAAELHSNGFQALVSYVETGFEPRQLTVNAGDTVRFTNNSTNQLWITSIGDTLYPAA